MTYRTEGMSTLEHFNLVMDEIRAGRGLVGPPTENEVFWREKLAPAHVEGINVLMVIVSRFGTINEDIENYELLLKATYGNGGWVGKGYIGEQDPNVKIQGPGFPTFIEFYGKYRKGENYAKADRIDQVELMKIIYGEAVLAGGYDQIHIVGHGGPRYGMLFYPLDERGERVDLGRPFRKEESMVLCKYHSWPLNPGGKVLLVGCDTDKGDFKEFIEQAVGPGNVYATEGIWKCCYGWVNNPNEKYGALDWYYKDHPGQHTATRAIGEWLNVPPAREHD